VSKSGQMVVSMKAIGLRARPTARADLFTRTEMFTMATGRMTKRTDMEFTHIWMVPVTRDGGKKTNSTVRG
jgi:hypothetical protein